MRGILVWEFVVFCGASPGVGFFRISAEEDGPRRRFADSQTQEQTQDVAMEAAEARQLNEAPSIVIETWPDLGFLVGNLNSHDAMIMSQLEFQAPGVVPPHGPFPPLHVSWATWRCRNQSLRNCRTALSPVCPWLYRSCPFGFRKWSATAVPTRLRGLSWAYPALPKRESACRRVLPQEDDDEIFGLVKKKTGNAKPKKSLKDKEQDMSKCSLRSWRPVKARRDKQLHTYVCQCSRPWPM